MGQEQLHALSFDQRYYAEDETTFGTFTRATATGAFKAKAVSIEPSQVMKPRRDNRVARGDAEIILGEYDHKWSAKGYVVPSGTAGTAPDIDLILRTAFGTRTTVGGTSVTYSPSSTQGDLGSFTLTRWARIVMHALAGCWVDDFKLSVKGSEEPEWEASGGGVNIYYTGSSTLNGAMSTSSSMTVQTADANNFRTNSIVQVGSNTNSGTGYRITAGTASPFTLEATLSSADQSDVLPYAPTETVAGSPAAGITGSFSIDGSNVAPYTAFEFNLKNNHSIHRHALTSVVADYTEGYLEIEGTFTLKMRRDQAIRLGNRFNSPTTNLDLAVVIGSTAGSIITINIDRARPKLSKIDFPEGAEEGEVTIPWMGLASASTASDNANIAFT